MPTREAMCGRSASCCSSSSRARGLSEAIPRSLSPRVSPGRPRARFVRCGPTFPPCSTRWWRGVSRRIPPRGLTRLRILLARSLHVRGRADVRRSRRSSCSRPRRSGPGNAPRASRPRMASRAPWLARAREGRCSRSERSRSRSRSRGRRRVRPATERRKRRRRLRRRRRRQHLHRRRRPWPRHRTRRLRSPGRHRCPLRQRRPQSCSRGPPRRAPRCRPNGPHRHRRRQLRRLRAGVSSIFETPRSRHAELLLHHGDGAGGAPSASSTRQAAFLSAASPARSSSSASPTVDASRRGTALLSARSSFSFVAAALMSFLSFVFLSASLTGKRESL